MTMTKPTSEQVTFTAAGSGATLRNLVDKVREVVSVKDFGAVGNGIADDTAAIQAAAASSASQIDFPAGTYILSANTTVSKALNMQPGAVISVNSGQTFTVNGFINAAPYQIFAGAGTVEFGGRSVSVAYPEWFGAVGDGTTDDSGAIQRAIDAFPVQTTQSAAFAGCIEFQSRNYGVATPIVMRSCITLRGAGGNPALQIGVENSVGLRLLSQNSEIIRFPEGCTSCRIRDLTFYSYTQIANWDNGTTAILWKPINFYPNATFPPSSFDHEITNCGFWGFERAIQILRADVSAGVKANADWQVDQLLFAHCRFYYFRKSGIYVETSNFDWSRIVQCGFAGAPRRTDTCRSIELTRCGFIQISDCSGSYVQPSGEVPGDPSAVSCLIWITDYTGSILISQCQNEGQPRFIDTTPGSGNLVESITLIANVHDAPSYFNHPRNIKVVSGLYQGGNDPRFYVTSTAVVIEDVPAFRIATTTNPSWAGSTHEIDLSKSGFKAAGWTFTDAAGTFQYSFPIAVSKYSVPTTTGSLIQVKTIPGTHRFFRLKLLYTVIGSPTYTISVKHKTVSATGLSVQNVNQTIASNSAPNAGVVMEYSGYAIAVDPADSLSWIEVTAVSNTTNAVYVWAELSLDSESAAGF